MTVPAERPWGALVATYFILMGLPSGLGLVTWALRRRGWPASIGRRADAVALAAMVIVGMLLLIDLGNPSRFYLMLTRFDNLSSPIAVGAKLIALKTALLAVIVYAQRPTRVPLPARENVVSARVLFLPDSLGARVEPLARTGVAVLSLALAVYPAAVLSRTATSPLAATSGSALLFVLSSIVIGAAAAVIITVLTPPADASRRTPAALRAALAAALTTYAVALVFEYLSIRGNSRLDHLVAAVTAGTYAPALWLGVCGVGLAAPTLLLILLPRSRVALIAAALTAATGACVARYLLFAVGG